MASKYRGALDRLQAMPAIFTGADAAMVNGWTSMATSTYLYQWKRRGLVAALGGHSDVFANLVVDRNPNWEAALLRCIPQAMLVGIEVLRRAGWTTQIPSRPDVAIPLSYRPFQTEHFTLHRRGDSLFQFRLPQHGSIAGRALPTISPANALADMLAKHGWDACGLQEDDIDWDEINDSQAAVGELHHALSCRGLAVELLTPQLDRNTSTQRP